MDEIKIRVDRFQDAMAKLINEYKDDALDIASEAARKAGRETVKELKATTHVKTGNYASGWTGKTEGRHTQNFAVVVYNRNAPGLPHLLNNDHAAGRNGMGIYHGDNHITRAELNGNELYYNEVVKKL